MNEGESELKFSCTFSGLMEMDKTVSPGKDLGRTYKTHIFKFIGVRVIQIVLDFLPRARGTVYPCVNRFLVLKHF